MTEANATSESSGEPSNPATGAAPGGPGAVDGRPAANDGPSAANGGRPVWPAFVGLAATVLAVDQLTKAWLTSVLEPGKSIRIAGDYLRLVHGRNAGGLFGLFQGQALPFAVVSLVVVLLIVGYHARSGRNMYLSVTLGLLLGGALGNLLDRIRLGYVVDFVDAGIGSLRWYTFNVADASISVAILLLLVASIWPSLTNRVGTEGRG